MGLAGGVPIARSAGAYLSSRIVEKAKTEAGRDWQLTQVVVASQDLAPGDAITYDLLAERSTPGRMVTSSLIRRDEVEWLYAQRLDVPIAAGEPVRRGFLAERPGALIGPESQITKECEHELGPQPAEPEPEWTVDQIRERMLRGGAR